MCGSGWNAEPGLSFAGWTMIGELELDEPNWAPDAPVFALITREAIDQVAHGDPSFIRGVGLCALLPNGTILVTTVDDDYLPRTGPPAHIPVPTPQA